MKKIALLPYGLMAVLAAGTSETKAGKEPLPSVESPIRINWARAAPLPLPQGIARPFAGESDDMILVAGGSYFKENFKQYSDEVFALDSAGKWTSVGKLPAKRAEGGSITTPQGIFCVGGTDGKTDSPQAFLLSLNDGTTKIQPLPPLPVNIQMPAVTCWGKYLFVACGRQNGVLGNEIFWMELGLNTWHRLDTPPLLTPRTQAIACAQNGPHKKPLLLIAGGTDNREALSDCWCYTFTASPANGQWTQTAPAPMSLVGASAIPVGDQHMLVLGGFQTDQWNQAMRLRGEALESFLARPPEAFQWNTAIKVYHTVTETWAPYGTIPFQPRCGAALLLKDKKLHLISGEIKPRVRTPDVQVGTFQKVRTFSTLNWLVIAGYFLLMGGVGWYFMRKEKTPDGFFRGGGHIPWYVVGMSIFATMLSSITFISIPTMTYIADWRYFPMVAGIFILAPIVIRFYLPFFCRLHITSAYEYLEKRFNLTLRLFASLAFNIFMVCRIAVVTLLPAIALQAVTGIDVNVCILCCGFLTILYCSLGGIEAVIWSDFIQGIILIGGALSVLAILMLHTQGSVSGFFATAFENGKLRMLDFRFLFKEPVFWVVIIQGFVGNLASYTSDQCVVQKYITTTNERETARSIWFNGVMSVFASIIFYGIGTALYTHYKSFPALMDITMPKSDSIFPTYMALELPPGMAGLIIAAIFAATISTLAANLNSSATAITTDFIMRFRKIPLTNRQQVRSGQLCTVAVGILGIGVSLFLAQMPSRSLFDDFQKFIAMLTSGLACLFFLGIFTTRVGGRAAITGLLANYICCYWLDLSSVSWKPHPFVYGGIGLGVCLVTAFLASFVFKQEKSDLHALTLYTMKS